MRLTFLFKNFFLIPFLYTVSATSQIQIKGYKIPIHYPTENAKLILNGAGMRVQYNFDIYIGALYLLNQSNNPLQILEANEPMCMRIIIASNLVTPERLLESIEDGFRRSTKGNTLPLQQKINYLKSAFHGKIKKREDFQILYEPGKGSSVYKNKEHILTIPGYEFKKALFGIWLGPDAAATELKEKLLSRKE